MSLLLKRAAIIGLVAFHLGGSAVMPFAHHDLMCGTSDGQRAIRSHDCGAKEVHKPIDDCRHCLLCLRDSTTVAVLAIFSTVPRFSIVPLEELGSKIPLSCGKHFSDPDRGPPTSPA